MKNKLILIAIVSLAVSYIIINPSLHKSQIKIDKLLLENAEALAQNEISGGDDLAVGGVQKYCAGDGHAEEYGCYADNHGASCKKQGDCRR